MDFYNLKDISIDFIEKNMYKVLKNFTSDNFYTQYNELLTVIKEHNRIFKVKTDSKFEYTKIKNPKYLIGNIRLQNENSVVECEPIQVVLETLKYGIGQNKELVMQLIIDKEFNSKLKELINNKDNKIKTKYNAVSLATSVINYLKLKDNVHIK